MSMTLLTFHSVISVLKEVHPLNIELMSMTLLTFHSVISVLKEVHPLNIVDILVTLLTSHKDRLELKVEQSKNAEESDVLGRMAGSLSNVAFRVLNWLPFLDNGIFPNWTISNPSVWSLKKVTTLSVDKSS
jgi:hypothetical protein